MYKFLGLAALLSFAAFSASSNYQLKSYGVNAGGTNNSSSSTYKLQAGTGEVNGNAAGAATYTVNSGSIQAQQANVPDAPTLSNGGGAYTNKLNFIINTSGNPTDTTYAVAVSTTSNFALTQYVQADGTLGSNPVFQTYSLWGSGSGTFAIGLTSSTTYYFKVSAMQGLFSATKYGPSASAATATPALSFSVSPNSLNMGILSSGTVISGPSDISFTYSTNSSYGGNIYMAGSSTGLVSAAAGGYNIHITGSTGDLSSLSEGFGAQGISATSPLTIQNPYNGPSDVVGAIFTTFQTIFSTPSSVSGGSATARIKARAASTTPAAKDYSDTLTFVAAANY